MKVVNRQARFDYEILETIEAGVVLTGPEAKSARLGQLDLKQAFVKIITGKPQLINLHIFPYKYADNEDYDPTRTRSLLLSKRETLALENKMKQQRLTLVPTAMYTRGPKVKVEIGLARGKKQYQKKETIKKRDLELEMERELRGAK